MIVLSINRSIVHSIVLTLWLFPANGLANPLRNVHQNDGPYMSVDNCENDYVMVNNTNKMDTFWAFLMGLITASAVILTVWLIVFGWCGVNRLDNGAECMCNVSSESFGGKIASIGSDRVENTNKKTYDKYYNKWRICGGGGQ